MKKGVDAFEDSYKFYEITSEIFCKKTCFILCVCQQMFVVYTVDQLFLYLMSFDTFCRFYTVLISHKMQHLQILFWRGCIKYAFHK